MTTFPGSPRVLKGALVSIDDNGDVRAMVGTPV